MTHTHLAEVAIATMGIVLSALFLVRARFGPASPFLSFLTFFLSLSCIALGGAEQAGIWNEDDAVRAAFSLLVLAVPSGVLLSLVLVGEGPWQAMKENKLCVAACSLAAPLLAASLFAVRPMFEEGGETPADFAVLGLGGFLAGFYLLGFSVVVLVNLERILRSVSEEARYEIKFLVLGLAGILATFIYVASQILLYPPQLGYLPFKSIHVFPFIFLASLFLVFISWRRSTKRTGIRVSHKAAFSSVTLLCVGLYLIASSLAAQWAGKLFGERVKTEVVVFLLAAIALGIAIFSTRVRGRLRHWMRRHVFSGRYDYRVSWLEATERIVATDPPRAMASAVCDLVYRGLRTDEATVWLLDEERRKLSLAASRGGLQISGAKEVTADAKSLDSAPAVLAVEDPPVSAKAGLGVEFLKQTKAALLAVLRSGGETIGVLTAGSDRSGTPYDPEAQEFLGVLAAHAAGELHKADFLRQREKAEEAAAFRTFSTFLLHDLKNFASTLSLIAKNAERHQDNPEFQRDAFHSAFEISEKMKRLCNSLNTFSDQLAANKKLEDLNGIVREVMQSLEESVSKRVRLDLGDVPEILVDRAQVARVLLNLLLNAHDAIGEGGTITVTTRRRDSGAEICVVDDGKGFPQDYLEKGLFLPFRTSKTQGMGIGLFQSKRIMEAHGGAIRVESEEGKGSKVRLLF